MKTGARILVVDDEPGVRRAAARILESAGYDVAVAASGEEALRRLGESFEVVVTDLKLAGGIDGNEVTRRFREAGSADVVIMTGYPELDTAVQGLQAGAYDYLVKPVAPQLLLAVVQRCLEKRALSADLAREKTLRAELDKAYKALAQLSKVRDIFGRFATPEVAELVMTHPEDFWMRGERRRVTVMFADVRGFTTYAASVSPEEASQALNEVFGALQDCIHPEGGVINKLLGDGAMIVFGAPLAVPQMEAAAARAALAAQKELQAVARRREARGLQGLGIGIGVNSGVVMTGYLGVKDRTEYSIIGAPINLAARLEKAAQPGQILVGPETAEALAAEFVLQDIGMMAFHGVKEVVPVHALMGRKVDARAKAAASRPGGA